MHIYAVDQIAAPPLLVPDRFRTEIVFFTTSPGHGRAPAKLPEYEYWIDLDEARGWLEEGVVSIVSPLDAVNKAQIELTEYHEDFLTWLVTHGVSHVRIGS
jgi:hypothetical protein